MTSVTNAVLTLTIPFDKPAKTREIINKGKLYEMLHNTYDTNTPTYHYIYTVLIWKSTSVYNLTVLNIRIGFLPNISEDAPINGEEKNCSKE